MKGDTPERFKPISPNPFIVGNPVRDASMFFGRKVEFELARKRFKDAEGGQLLVFCGERRSGKTSILYQIAQGRLGPEYLPVLIDMQSMAIEDERNFLVKVCTEVLGALQVAGAELPVPDFSTGNPSAVFQEFIEQVLTRHPGKKLILAFDEYELFENKIESGTLTQDVLNILAALMDRYSVFIIFTGSQHIEARKANFWRLLPRGIYRRISYLSYDDALDLMTRPVEGRLQYLEGSLDYIFRQTAGQPFYTQAVCQSLVDHANDMEVREVSVDLVSEVVDSIVDNPFPQMIFLWDGLDQDAKLVLSLLGEALADDQEFATVRNLLDRIKDGGYPLQLTEHAIASTLENLFKDELLLKDRNVPAGFAFRMDLWRRWVRHMHSVWQVVREEKIGPIAPRRSRKARAWFVSGLVAAVLALGATSLWLFGHGLLGIGNSAPDSSLFGDQPPSAEAANVLLKTVPPDADIRYGDTTAVGSFRATLTARQAHEFDISARGYRDSVFIPEVRGGQAQVWDVALKPRLATVRVESTPTGATVELGGVVLGPTPRDVGPLAVPERHHLVLSRPGYEPVDVWLAPHALSEGAQTRRWTLQPMTAEVMATSTPSEARVWLDGEYRSTTPYLLSGLSHQDHRIRMEKEGFTTAETTLVVDERSRSVHLQLRPVPDGYLVVLGTELASEILVNDVLVAEGVQNSSPLTYRPGTYSLEIRLQQSGAVVRDEVKVISGKTVYYDYVTRQATSEPAGDQHDR